MTASSGSSRRSDTQNHADRRTVLFGGAALGLVGTGPFHGANSVRASTDLVRTQIVRTTNGPVRGYAARGVQVFKGVRYGASPAAANRFLLPRKPEPWTEVADAITFGNSAVQESARPALDPSSPQARMAGLFVEEKVGEEPLSA